ncbi:MAG: ATP-binding protein [Pyrinomonadaceae bacterium]
MSTLQFPNNRKKKIVVTGQMNRVMRRTIRVHPGGALVVWSGQSRVGKTTTAGEMIRQLGAVYDPDDPDAFRCVHYQVGEIPDWSGQEQKRGIRSLYHKCIGRLDEGQYRTLPTEALALQLVHGLKRKNIRMLFIDEAGTLSVDAIRGMVLVRDVAENEGWTLSMVFIGMDDLPTKMCSVQQIEKRIHEWCYFQEYSVTDLFKMLQELHPHFASLRLENPDQLEQVQFIHNKFGGVPGEVIPFLTRLDSRTNGNDGLINLTLLKTVYISTQMDKEASIDSVTKSRAPKSKLGNDVPAKKVEKVKKAPKLKRTPIWPIGGNTNENNESKAA